MIEEDENLEDILDDVDISAEEIAKQLVAMQELEGVVESQALEAVEFGVHALDIFINAMEDESFEPLAMIADAAQLYIAFRTLKNLND